MQRTLRNRRPAPGARVDQEPATSDMAPGGNDAEQRRERKRQTDRVAQREHRKRQKLYIEELEAQITVLKSAGRTDSSKLATQNLRLREELKQMHCLWDDMEQLLRRQREMRQKSIINEIIADSPLSSCQPDDLDGPDSSSQTSPPEMRRLRADVYAEPPDQLPIVLDTMQPPMFADSEEADLNASSMGPSRPDRSHPSLGPDSRPQPGESTDFSNVDMFGMDDWELDPLLRPNGNSGAGMTVGTVVDAETTYRLPRRTSTAVQGTRWSQNTRVDASAAQISAPEADQHDGITTPTRRKRPRRISNAAHDAGFSADSQEYQALSFMEGFNELFGLCMDNSLHSLSPSIWPMDRIQPPSGHRTLPLLLFPPLPEDRNIHGIIERARQNPEAIGPPTLADFLFDNPRNPLSTDLKALLAPVRQARRVSEFLATYWLLYLLLRWHVVQSDEAFQSLPEWFRPTPLQLSVLHPMAADLIAWPEIREGLIHMSMTEQRLEEIATISTDVGRYLTVDIQANESDLWGSSQQHITSQILNLANWKLDKEFFERYPQWKGLAAQQALTASTLSSLSSGLSGQRHVAT